MNSDHAITKHVVAVYLSFICSLMCVYEEEVR